MQSKTLFLVITSVALMTQGCTKDPMAKFYTDKQFYFAGETIQLKNASEDGEYYQWTLPNGKISGEFELDYQTDPNLLYEELTFKLTAYSKNGKKKAETSHKVVACLKPKLEPNTFENEHISFRDEWPDQSFGGKGTSYASIDEFNLGNISYNLLIYFMGDLNKISDGIFSFKSDYESLKSNETYVYFYQNCPDCVNFSNNHFNIAVEGKLVVYSDSGYLHIIVNDAKAVVDNIQGLTENISVHIVLKVY